MIDSISGLHNYKELTHYFLNLGKRGVSNSFFVQKEIVLGVSELSVQFPAGI